MLFKPHHIRQIRLGWKTATRREWAENYAGPKEGSVIAATTELFVPNEEADCWIEIVDRYRQPLGEMTDEDAQKEGDYETVEEFQEAYEEIVGPWDTEKVVDVLEFNHLGRFNPYEKDAKWFLDQIEGTEQCLHLELEADYQWWIVHDPSLEYDCDLEGPWLQVCERPDTVMTAHLHPRSRLQMVFGDLYLPAPNGSLDCSIWKYDIGPVDEQRERVRELIGGAR